MRKKLLCLILALSVTVSLCSCFKKPLSVVNESESIENSEPDSEAEENIYGGGYPWVNSNIYENFVNATDVDLKDDFALAVNKQWQLEHPIPEGEQMVSYEYSFGDTLHERVKAILEDASLADDPNGKNIQAFYNAFLDWDARNAAGAEPIKDKLKQIEAANSWDELLNEEIENDSYWAFLFKSYETVNPTDYSQKVLAISSPTVFYAARAIEDMSEYESEIFDNDMKLVRTVMLKAGYSKDETEDYIKQALAFEDLVKPYCWNEEDAQNQEMLDAVYKQVYRLDKVNEISGADIYTKYLKKYGYTDKTLIFMADKMDFFEHTNEIYCDGNLNLIKGYLIVHTAYEAGYFLDEECYNLYQQNKSMKYGIDGVVADDNEAVNLVIANLSWPLSRLYCDRYVSADDKENIRNYIDLIIGEYKEMISEEEFLSEDTKKKAVEKLDKMEINCMYPEVWPDYTDMNLSGDFYDICCAVKNYNRSRNLKEFYNPIERTKWYQSPIDTNAFYEISTNSIYILPGFIGDNFYNDKMSKEEVLATLGVTIGHEISHAFDRGGAKCGADGQIEQWWTEEDFEEFNKRCDKLIEYYDNVSVYKDVYCIGSNICDEACADMAAMSCMLNIAKKYDDFDYDKFFKSYSVSYAGTFAPGFANEILYYNEHPLNYLRVNAVLAQFDEFCETYDIKEGDGMYISPEDRITVW